MAYSVFFPKKTFFYSLVEWLTIVWMLRPLPLYCIQLHLIQCFDHFCINVCYFHVSLSFSRPLSLTTSSIQCTVFVSIRCFIWDCCCKWNIVAMVQLMFCHSNTIALALPHTLTLDTKSYRSEMSILHFPHNLTTIAIEYIAEKCKFLPYTYQKRIRRLCNYRPLTFVVSCTMNRRIE